MQVFREISSLTSYINEKKALGLKVGFVPTMGALHQGHGELIKRSVNDCDVTICSIFVNPTQFNNPQDLISYPRQEKEDLIFLKERSCDAVFIPEVSDIYNSPALTQLNFGKLEEVLEGAFRPGHFKGVGIVVIKLFNIVRPHIAYFGQKDLQQLAIIKQIVRDFSFQIDIQSVETQRVENGLAMSSRNKRLSEDGKKIAASLQQTLIETEQAICQGKSFVEIKQEKLDALSEKGIDVEYLEFVDAETFVPIANKKGIESVALCIAANIEGVRLIDNRIF